MQDFAFPLEIFEIRSLLPEKFSVGRSDMSVCRVVRTLLHIIVLTIAPLEFSREETLLVAPFCANSPAKS